MRYTQIQTELRANPKHWLVTGCAGFIGSHILETLLKLDQSVTGLDNFSTGRQENLDEVQSLIAPKQWARFRFVQGDIRNLEACLKACAGADFVLHQAALGSVPRSIDNPIATHETNVSGFLNMLVAARDQRVKRFVYASSSSVYGDNPDLPKVEDKVGRPLSPYAVTKAVNEMYAEVFARVYGVETIGLRYFNVFGTRQDPNGPYAAVIPQWINALLKGAPVYINGDGETSRDFCYVENVVQANVLAATSATVFGRSSSGSSGPRFRPLAAQVFNIATGDRITLAELYVLISESLRNQILVPREPVYRPFRVGDVKHSVADLLKARGSLGYAPQYVGHVGLDLILKRNILHPLAQPAAER